MRERWYWYDFRASAVMYRRREGGRSAYIISSYNLPGLQHSHGPLIQLTFAIQQWPYLAITSTGMAEK